MKMGPVLRLCTLAVLTLWLAHVPAQAQSTTPLSATTIPSAQLVQPEQLAGLLQKPAAARPLILQVGSHVMYTEAHIPGSEYAGPGSRSEGLDLLRRRVQSLSHSRPIVLYCGCCPWTRCPNVGPAYKLLHDMGFTHVRVLYLANNFGSDWAGKGYPVAHGD